MLTSSEIEAMFRQALQMHQRGLSTHAKAMYEKILDRDPQHFDSLHLLGVAHMQTGAPEKAADLISRALKINPQSADAHYNLGLALRSLRRMDEALSRLESAISIRPGFSQYRVERGIMLQALGKPAEALACFDEAIRLDPALADAHRRKAGALVKLNRLEEALTSCAEALRCNPRYAEAHSLKGKILGKLERLHEALRSHDIAVKLNPRLADAYRQLARIQARLQRLEESAANYGRAVQLEPQHVQTYIDRAAILNELRRHDDALASCDRAIDLDHTSAKAHTERGYALGKLHRMDEAAKSFRTALELGGDPKAALSGRAWLNANCERWESARQDYEDVLSRDKDDEYAWIGLADLPVGTLPPERASEILKRLERKLEGPDLATRLFLKARLLQHLGRHRESFECLREANQLRQPELVQPERWRQHFAETHQKVKNWEPRHAANEPSESCTRLLVILGPSRSGKTTLEKQMCGDASFLRGFEGVSATLAINTLWSLVNGKEVSGSSPRSEVSWRVVEALFQSKTDVTTAGKHRVITITNPFLLAAAHLIHDLHPQSHFVFLAREAMDNAAEIFAKDYRDRYLFAYSPRDALDYVNLYQKASAVLCRKMGSRAMTVSYEDLLSSPGSVLSAIYGMLGLDPPRDAVPAGEARDPRSVYREYFAALCAEQGIALERYRA